MEVSMDPSVLFLHLLLHMIHGENSLCGDDFIFCPFGTGSAISPPSRRQRGCRFQRIMADQYFCRKAPSLYVSSPLHADHHGAALSFSPSQPSASSRDCESMDLVVRRNSGLLRVLSGIAQVPHRQVSRSVPVACYTPSLISAIIVRLVPISRGRVRSTIWTSCPRSLIGA